MRSHPVDRPQAAARNVALAVVADGDIGDAEIDWLDRLAVHEKLGLARHELHALLDTFCEDLLSSGQLQWSDARPVDERTLADLVGEIQDPALHGGPQLQGSHLASTRWRVVPGQRRHLSKRLQAVDPTVRTMGRGRRSLAGLFRGRSVVHCA